MLEGYDRPIVTDPEFFPDKRDALIGEFENYLKILKAVRRGRPTPGGLAGHRAKPPRGSTTQLQPSSMFSHGAD